MTAAMSAFAAPLASVGGRRLRGRGAAHRTLSMTAAAGRRAAPAAAPARRESRLDQQDVSEVLSSEVPGLPSWRFAGPPLSEGPLPAVIYFALEASQSLSLAPFNGLVHSLISPDTFHQTSIRTPPRVRVFSVTLPFHGTMPQNQAAFLNWATTYSNGTNLVSKFAGRVTDDLNAVLLPKYISSLHLAGLSRGGMIATTIAAAIPTTASLLLLAPVTSLTALSEFDGVVTEDEGDVLRVIDNGKSPGTSRLGRECAVRVYMGNRDRRVSTRKAFDFVEELSERAYDKRFGRTPQVELQVYGSVGSEGHGTPPEVFAKASNWVARKITEDISAAP